MPPSTAVAARPATAASLAAGGAAPAQNVAQAQRASILAKVASRFGMDPTGFASTLRSTVFKGASNEEFAALLVVADQYGLNPLTKEMYAFPQKGGGIVPLVSIDGWIRIMNDHPQYDGIEFNDLPDAEGKLIAIEAIIYRKDRTRPIRVTEYLDECKGNTAPWSKSPARMLRHRALIQCARIAFGFSGIYTDDDVEAAVTLGGDTASPPMRNVTPEQQQAPRQIATSPAQVERFDQSTGEVEDDLQDAGPLDEDAERALDQAGFAAMEGRADEDHGDQNDGDPADPESPTTAKFNELRDRLLSADLKRTDLPNVEKELTTHRDALEPEQVRELERMVADAKKRLR